MEARDHFKNGASLKSQMSRGNILRKVLFFACFTILASVCVAQDIIVTKDSKRINAKVMEVNEDNIKYKNFDNQDGPVYTLSKSNIVTILYKNGQVETFETESSKPAAATQITQVPRQTNAMSNRTQVVSSDNILADMKAYSPALYSQYKSGKRMATSGSILTGVGGVSAGLGAVFVLMNRSGEMVNVGYGFLVMGSLSAAAGVSILIVGGSKKNNAVRNFNRQYYSSQPSSPHFQFNVYPNRVGLAYVF
jgi:cytochrome c biogenesis factor